MAKKVGQVRYYSAKGGRENSPSSLTGIKLRSGSAFDDVYPIVQLGIQTLPGVRITINNASTPIVIGSTGIYELNVDGLSQITSLKFETNSLTLIDNNPNSYIIIDYIYDKEG